MDLYWQDPRSLILVKREIVRKVFEIPSETRLAYLIAVLTTWVDLVETRLRLDWERRTKLTIVRWTEKGLP